MFAARECRSASPALVHVTSDKLQDCDEPSIAQLDSAIYVTCSRSETVVRLYSSTTLSRNNQPVAPLSKGANCCASVLKVKIDLSESEYRYRLNPEHNVHATSEYFHSIGRQRDREREVEIGSIEIVLRKSRTQF